MTKVLVLYYSSYGHIETMAYAVAEGAKSAGAEVVVKRVPELVPEDVAKSSHFKLDQAAPIATAEELAEYDAIIVGSGTRFGTVTSQMRNFWDQTGGLWFAGKLVGKVGSVFTSTGSQHGGQETTILGFIPLSSITAWSLQVCLIRFRARWAWTKSRAARLTVRPRSPMVMARASLRPLNWKAPNSRVHMSPSSQRSFQPKF